MTGSGKLSISALRRIVSQMQANPQDAGAMLKRRRTARRVDYFALTQSLGALKPGIYGRRGHEILPIVIFVARPQYRKKFNFLWRCPPQRREELPHAIQARASQRVEDGTVKQARGPGGSGRAYKAPGCIRRVLPGPRRAGNCKRSSLECTAQKLA